MARKKTEPIMAEPVVESQAAQTEAPKTRKKAEAQKTGVVFGGTLNVRKEPAQTATILGTLEDGAKITILEDLGEWLKIDTGYVMKKWVK